MARPDKTATVAELTEQFRDSNAAWPQQVQGDWSRYSGGYSAPAGR